MRFVRHFTAGAIAAALSTAAFAQGALVKVDGSSTVFPVTEAVAEDFQKAKKGAVTRHGRHLRHRRRLQEVLPRRDRHLQRLAADPEGRDGGVQARRASSYIELPVAFDALTVVVNPKNTLVDSRSPSPS